MDNRVTRLEAIASDVLARLARIEATMATKDDLHRLEVTLIKWVVGTAGGVGIAMVTVMTFVLNNAVPKPTPPAPPPVVTPAPPSPVVAPAPPIIIMVPSSGVQWQALPPK